ncbi:MAG: hypothetical protein H6610_05415 [Ignavibacteriales bacterium]|nr:hypothetical protein [Ignavibacteriales bacterium]MCB9218880.1 hypothetical protein [Ignavibacteriales bacterium]
MRAAFIFIISFLLFGCGSSSNLNDFFGIQMNPTEENNFKIVSYNDTEGIKYQSSVNMNPNINAWAEIGVEKIYFKITNNSNLTIPLNYDSDNFVIITNEKEYYINKGNRYEYFYGNKIDPNSYDEIALKIPSDFSQDFVKREGAMLQKDIMGDVSKNWSPNTILKENVKYILLKFENIVIVLKKVPESN